MRVSTSESSSVSMTNEYAGEYDNPDTSDDTQFWRKESPHRFGVVPSIGHSRWILCAVISVTTVILMILIITVSVSHVKFERKFLATEMTVKNLNQTLQSIISRSHNLEENGHKVKSDINNLEFDLQTMQGNMDDMSESTQILSDRVSELKCLINKISSKNNTEEQCCPDGWSLFSSHCYFFSKNGMSWNSAKDECENKRSQLLIVNSRQEKEFVVSKTTPLYFWLGLTDGRTGEWEWLDRTPYVMVKSEWMPGQPDNWEAHGLGGGEDCAHFHRDGRYNDDHCSRRYRFVCKA
ncbi:C-type lectin domain family 10 member A [Xyrauchen texanus]|uniref:C-type lectin domain family 10 member A n=1 Tax=Xyrauchen texanus TaxID=154827 RepID=UPI00224281B1|nr:C-type lectin domain family 10 member A [Xyrauchen texanus]